MKTGGKKSGIKLYCILFAIYWFLVFSPFIFPALNQIEPTLFSMPFTFWYTHVVIILGCILVYIGSKYLWTSYDESLGEEGEHSNE